MMTRILHVILFSLLMQTAFAADSLFYRIRSGDQLGVVLYSLGFAKLWGPRGAVQKFANSQRRPVPGQGAPILKNGDLIEPGTWIEFQARLPLACNAQVFAKEVNILKKIKTEKQLKAFRCPDGSSYSRELASVSIEVIKKKNRLVVRPRISFFKSDLVDNSNGVEGEVVSESNIGVNVQWQKPMGEQARGYVFGDIESVKFQKPDNRTFVGDDAKTLFRAGAGYRRWLTNDFEIDASLSWGSDFFVFAPSTTSLRVDSANTFRARTQGRYTFYKGETTNVGALANLTLIPKKTVENYTSKSSLGYGAGFFMIKQLKNEKMFLGDISFEKQDKNTTAYDQSYFDIRFNFGISWDL